MTSTQASNDLLNGSNLTYDHIRQDDGKSEDLDFWNDSPEGCQKFMFPSNPYTVGGPLRDPNGHGFYGRDDIFAFIRDALNARQRAAILLCGQRRIGKTSILSQLPSHLPHDHICVFFDLLSVASMDLNSILYGLARTITDRLSLQRPDRGTMTAETFTSRFLPRVIEALDNHPERLILLFDEIDVLDGPLADGNTIGSEFVRYLSTLILQQPRLGYVLVSGRNPIDLSPNFKETIGKDLVLKQVGRLSREQTRKLIEEPSKGYLDFTKDACDRIYDLTAGHPYCTQLLCNVIWSQRTIAQPAPPVQVTRTHIDTALQPALDMAGTGLDWVFDGLTHPAHRLFLASLAGVAAPPNSTGASLDMIHQALIQRHVDASDVEVSRAPLELRHWDVITQRDNLTHFAVPMIGTWIRQERSLDHIMREIRYVNPRAQDYYEKAQEAHRNGNFDQAIRNYTSALGSHPSFLDAQKNLATALRERRHPGDLEAAIEAHERVLELDPETPINEFFEVLAASLETPINDIDTVVDRYKRIRELDKEGKSTSRAERIIRDKLIPEFRYQPYQDIEKIYDALDDSEMAGIIRRRKKFRRIMSYIMLTYIFIFPLLLLYNLHMGLLFSEIVLPYLPVSLSLNFLLPALTLGIAKKPIKYIISSLPEFYDSYPARQFSLYGIQASLFGIIFLILSARQTPSFDDYLSLLIGFGVGLLLAATSRNQTSRQASAKE